jgi:hypothetical protein
MLRIELTTRSDKHIPFSITGTGTDRVCPKAKTHHAGSDRDVAACELNLSGPKLVVGCACFLGAAKFCTIALPSASRSAMSLNGLRSMSTAPCSSTRLWIDSSF